MHALSPAVSLLEAGLKVGGGGGVTEGCKKCREFYYGEPVFSTTTILDGAYPLDLSKSTPDSEMLNTQCLGTGYSIPNPAEVH